MPESAQVDVEQKVAAARDACEARWREEVLGAGAALVDAVHAEDESYTALSNALPDDRTGCVKACFTAIDKRHAARGRLERLSSDSELERRLRNAEKLARIEKRQA